MPNVLNVLTKLAPTIGTALGGPLAGTAITAIESALGVTPKPDADLTKRQDAVTTAIAGATPDQLLALKKADEDFELQMKKLGFDDMEALAKLSNDDRDSARKREIAVKDWTPKVLTSVVVASFVGVIIYSRFLPDNRIDIIRDGLTTLRDALMVIVAYYFGSSAGSARQTELLAKAPPVA